MICCTEQVLQREIALEMMRDSFDQKQLEEAKSLDQVSYTDDYLGEKAAADSWELSLHSFLRQEGIPFQTEDEMRAKGELEIMHTVFISFSISLLLITTSANTFFLSPVSGCTSTPDVVFSAESDVKINSQSVRWMDCKSYYGSATAQSFYKKHVKQIQKYNTEFGGNGAVVFKLGFSEDLVNNIQALFLFLLPLAL